MRLILTQCNRLVVALLLGLPTSVGADNENELLALAKAGNRSAQESIRSLSCTVSLEGRVSAHTLLKTGKYWRMGSDARLQEDQPTGTVDYFYMGRDSEIRDVVRNRPGTDQPAWAVGRQLITHLALPLDVWRLMFLEFDLLLPTAKGIPRVKRERIDRRDCIRVSIDVRSETELTFWLDVGRNYLVWKRVMATKGDRDEREVLEFIEPQAGVFFPTRVGCKSFRGRSLRDESFATLSDIRVNEPVSKDLLRLPVVPRGTICDDWIKKQKYPIDENWQQIPGSTRPLERYALPAAIPGQEGVTAQSTREARSWTWLIAPASLAVLVLAGAARLYRRFQGRSRAAD